jgi:histidinol-phosphate aminotransferase
MKTTRRGFVKTIGFTTAAGVLTGTSLLSRSVQAQTRKAHLEKVYDGGVIQLNQNESARGPGPKTMEAIHTHTTKRIGRGYSPDHVNELIDVIAAGYNIERNEVLLATGSSPLLQGSVRAFCAPDKPLVTAGPTYSTSEGTARSIDAPIERIQVGNDGKLQLDVMADTVREVGAGLVYICNPNNPTGTVHSPQAIEAFVRRIMSENPYTVVHLDEAYINYADPSVMETALPLALEFERVFITRSFSKAHGMAGLRVGYALGQEQTLDMIDNAWGMGDVNMIGAIAALTAFEDYEHIEWERHENAEIREFTVAAIRDLGFEVWDSHTNHIFPNLRRPAREFREACLQHNILVGRDFPPLAETHSRISLGSREEMQQAVEVFRRVLG